MSNKGKGRGLVRLESNSSRRIGEWRALQILAVVNSKAAALRRRARTLRIVACSLAIYLAIDVDPQASLSAIFGA